MSNFFNNYKTKPRYDRTYRQQDRYRNSGYDGNAKRNDSSKRNDSKGLVDLLDKLIPSFKSFLESNTLLQTRLADIAELQIKIEEQKTMALQKIAIAVENVAGTSTEIEPIIGDLSVFAKLNKIAPEETTQDEHHMEDTLNTADSGKETQAIETQDRPTETTKKDTSGTPAPMPKDRRSTVETIVELREGGMYFKQIAQHLESNGVPTLSGKGGWNAQMVSRLFKDADA